jgi:hypothetical protein
MYFWNDDNFNGLKEIGEKYASESQYEAFSRYCLFKEKGLKNEAKTAIEQFIVSNQSKSKKEQRNIIEELSALNYRNKKVHQLIPHQLQQYMISVLGNWSEEEPGNAIPYRWLGFIKSDLHSYKRAIEIDSNDIISLIAIISFNLNHVDYQTHHLNESMFIGKLDEADELLDEVNELLCRIVQTDVRDNILSEYYYYRKLLDSWKEYKTEKMDIGFPEWAELRKQDFRFHKAYYYKK